MRSSKSRSRGNKNRNRPTGGSIVNRVFDSSGPEGKVRGTPQQIFDKYQQLYRDAQLAGDRVDAENFAQHAEHYLRLLASAQKEIDAKREEQERQNRDRQAERDRERVERLQAQESASNGAGGAGDQPAVAQEPRAEGGSNASADTGPNAGSDSGLVETPESKPRRQRRPRKPAPEKAQAQDAPTSQASTQAAPQTPEQPQPEID